MTSQTGAWTAQRGLAPSRCVAWAIALAALASCATGKKDVSGSGDDRYDDTSSPDKPRAVVKDSSQCGAEGKGDVVLLDARTTQPVACSLVTIFQEASGCEDADCPPESIFQGHTNTQGLVVVGKPIAQSRIYAVAEGYAQSYRYPSPISAGHVAEIELLPDDGFLLKIVDSEGNYLPGVEVTFKQGEEVLSKIRTNDLANVFFNERSPFAGEPVTVAVEGYPAVTVSSASELGADGHTVTVRR
jgi:hypothetical protein